MSTPALIPTPTANQVTVPYLWQTAVRTITPAKLYAEYSEWAALNKVRCVPNISVFVEEAKRYIPWRTSDDGIVFFDAK